ncbi:MAG: amidohydrolase [Halobacteriales archaeon]
MPDTDALKDRVRGAIDEQSEEIVSLAKSIQDEPELGFKETETTRKVIETFEEMGLDVEEPLAVTGARARIGSGDPVIAVLGELDALVNPEHPMADPETGACHACGHHAQIATMIGTAIAFATTDVVDELDGRVEAMAVPAEEYLDLGYRRSLKDEGTIEFFGGKQELLRRGHFDDVDAAMMVHAADDTPEREVTARNSTNGFVGKFVTYTGKTSHAGGAPDEGVNALNAAVMGMNGIHAARERFRDEDAVRVHPIMTRGGDGVNVVPSEVTMESYTRAKTIEAIDEANDDVNAALEAGAMAVGARVEIDDEPGYMPLRTNDAMVDAYEANAADLLGDDAIVTDSPHLTGSTDMGDVSQVVPSLHPWGGGFEGNVHQEDFAVADEEMAYVTQAKILAGTIVDLLADPEAIEAIRAAKDEKKSREEYLEDVRTFQDRVVGDYLD